MSVTIKIMNNIEKSYDINSENLVGFRGSEGSSPASCEHRARRVAVRGHQDLDTKQNPPIACDRPRYWKCPLHLDTQTTT